MIYAIHTWNDCRFIDDREVRKFSVSSYSEVGRVDNASYIHSATRSTVRFDTEIRKLLTHRNLRLDC